MDVRRQGTALSPDERWLFYTETSVDGDVWMAALRQALARGQGRGRSVVPGEGAG